MTPEGLGPLDTDREIFTQHCGFQAQSLWGLRNTDYRRTSDQNSRTATEVGERRAKHDTNNRSCALDEEQDEGQLGLAAYNSTFQKTNAESDRNS